MLNVIKKLDKFIDLCDRAFLFAAVSMLIIMLATNVANILCRNLLGFTLLWVFGLTQVLFVWANFLIFFVLYRRSKDISVHFFIEKMPFWGQTFARYVSHGAVLFVVGALLLEAPGILALQVGPISESVELERYFLSIPLFVSAFLILVDMLLQVFSDLFGVELPYRVSSRPKHSVSNSNSK